MYPTSVHGIGLRTEQQSCPSRHKLAAHAVGYLWGCYPCRQIDVVMYWLDTLRDNPSQLHSQT